MLRLRRPFGWLSSAFVRVGARRITTRMSCHACTVMSWLAFSSPQTKSRCTGLGRIWCWGRSPTSGEAARPRPPLRLPVSPKVARNLAEKHATMSDTGNLRWHPPPPARNVYVGARCASGVRTPSSYLAPPHTFGTVRGLPGCLETVGCCSLVVEVGTGATPCHNGAGYALRCEFGLHNGVIRGQMGPNSLRKA